VISSGAVNRSPRRGLLLAALVVALTPYLVNLGGSTIWDANEAYYVETPREMLESGDYLNPSFNYEPRFNKPVLSYWIVAGLYQLFGVSVATQRLAIVAGAFIILTAAFVLGRAVSGDLRGGLLAALGLATAPRFFMFSRRILIDIANTAAMSVILVFFALSELYPAYRRRYLYLMYVSVGIGVLIKGPAAAVLPALVFAVYLIAHGELRRLREMMLIQGAVIVALIVAPWYLALYAQHGWTYINEFFVGENVNRYLSPVGPQDDRGFLFYIPVLLTDTFPWSVCVIGAVVSWWKSRRVGREPDTAHRVRTLLVLWCGVIALFFTFSRTKQDLYIFPVAPAMAALGGWFVYQLLTDVMPSARRWFVGTFSAIAIVLITLGALVVTVFVKAEAVYPLEGALLIGAVSLAGGVLMVLRIWRDARLPAVACGLAALMVTNWLLALRVLPAFERYKPVAPLSAVISDRAQPSDVIANYDLALPSMTYYLRRHVDVMFDREPFVALMRSGRRVFAVLPATRYEELRADFPSNTCVIARHKTADVKLRNVLGGVAPPEVVVALTPCGPS
jgi:4-amino-4-deoxy-L-arabinose transferase-like glycosyltransferase